MSLRYRLWFLLISLALLGAVGVYATGSFRFVFSDFWFASGLLLLLLLSLIDQPHFSKDANVFVNGVTGLVALLTVPAATRDSIWNSFLAWSLYLVISSCALMWVRSRELATERPSIQVISRVNRSIGRPEAIFSALFLWGVIQRFGQNSAQTQVFFLFWAIFMILNLPAIAKALSEYLDLDASGRQYHRLSTASGLTPRAGSEATGRRPSRSYRRPCDRHVRRKGRLCQGYIH